MKSVYKVLAVTSPFIAAVGFTAGFGYSGEVVTTVALASIIPTCLMLFLMMGLES